MEIKELVKSIDNLCVSRDTLELNNIHKRDEYCTEIRKKCAELYKALVGHTLWDGKNILYIYEASETTIVCVQMSDMCIYPKLVESYEGIKDYLFTLDTATEYYSNVLKEYTSILNKINGKEL